MTRIAIISDIHGNLEALESVLGHLGGQGVDQLICLGDVVGYGPDPEACCRLVREHAAVTVLGNHDAAVAGLLDSSSYRLTTRVALDLHRRLLSPESREWLETVPYTYQGEAVTYSHGLPFDPPSFHYLLPDDSVVRAFRARDVLAPVTFLGHSHLCLSYHFDEQGVSELEPPCFRLEPGTSLITVGSVGQPRDADPRAAYVIYEPDERMVTFHRVVYPVETTCQKIVDAGLPEYFGHRLMAGR